MNIKNNEIDYGNYYEAWPVSFYQSTLGMIIIVFITIFILSAIILLGLMIFNRKRSRPESIARKELKKIMHQIKDSNLKIDILYLELTKILKNYVQKKHNISASSLTDLELIDYLDNLKIAKDLKDLIAILIMNAENSKYAFKDVPKEKLELDINNSFLFIDKTCEKITEK